MWRCPRNGIVHRGVTGSVGAGRKLLTGFVNELLIFIFNSLKPGVNGLQILLGGFFIWFIGVEIVDPGVVCCFKVIKSLATVVDQVADSFWVSTFLQLTYETF